MTRDERYAAVVAAVPDFYAWLRKQRRSNPRPSYDDMAVALKELTHVDVTNGFVRHHCASAGLVHQRRRTS